MSYLQGWSVRPCVRPVDAALADVGWLAIHGHAARHDQVFHVAARTETGFGQHLVQLRRVVVGRQVAAVVNFPPRQIGPVMSEVLTLGFPDADGKVVLVTPSGTVPNGGRLF